MPLGVTLLELRRELRAETGTSMNPAQGTQAQGALDIVLARQQRELWDAYNWQHLKFWIDMRLASGQSVYSYPPEMMFDQITQLWVSQIKEGTYLTPPVWANTTMYNTGDRARDTSDNTTWQATATHISSEPPQTFAQFRQALPWLWDAAPPVPDAVQTSPWKPLRYGIGAGAMQQGVPPLGTPARWRNVATVSVVNGVPITNPVGQFELLPAPNNDDTILRVEGQAPLSPLVADTDSCIIDSKAIVLFAAAEVMAVQKSEAAPMKLTKAQNYLRRILADQGADKRTNYNMGGYQRGGFDPDKSRRTVPYVDYVP